MKNFIAAILLTTLAVRGYSAPAVMTPANSAGRVLKFSVDTFKHETGKPMKLPILFKVDDGRMYLKDGTPLIGSALLSDSKKIAARLPNGDFVLAYSGPRYGHKAELQKTQAQLNAMGKRERRIYELLSAHGLAPAVLSEGSIKDGSESGMYYQTVAKLPEDVRSGRAYMRAGKFHHAPIIERVREIGRRLAQEGHYIEKYNPTIFALSPSGGYIIKAYIEDATSKDRKFPPPSKDVLLRHYADSANFLEAMSRVYPKLRTARKEGQTLSEIPPNFPIADRVEMMLLVWDAMLYGRTLRFHYTNSSGAESEKVMTPVRGKMPKDDFMKGYARFIYPGDTSKKDPKEFTFRLDRMSWVELL